MNQKRAKIRKLRGKKGIFFFFWVNLVVIFSFFPFVAQAGFNLSVSPYQGGADLRFGRVSAGEIVNEEVKIRIDSSLTERYQIRQRLLEPLENEKGQRLSSQAVSFHTLRGSNSYGSLYQDYPDQLGRSERVLYSSAPNGQSDSLGVVYTVDGSKIDVGGRFSGRILYQLIPLGGVGSERRVILNVSLNAEKDFKIEVETSTHSSRVLRLSTQEDRQAGYIVFTLARQLGERYNITQIVDQPLQNEKGERLSDQVLKFSVSSKKGTPEQPSPVVLPRGVTRVYLSEQDGQGDEVVVSFFINQDKLGEIPAGNFRARFLYDVKSNASLLGRIPIDIELEAKALFSLEVGAELGEELAFRNLTPGQGVVRKESVIEVKSNLNKPYSVAQNLGQPLTNEKGDIIPLENFQMKVVLAEEEEGRPAFSQFHPVKQGDTFLFFSDRVGSPAKFKIVYELEVDENTAPGDYFTSLSFSLLER